MKIKTTIFSTLLSVLTLSVIAISCSAPAAIANKSGAQVWGENCVRCHNAASPETFSDVEWDVAGMHMQIRANLTQAETDKVVKFLQLANR